MADKERDKKEKEQEIPGIVVGRVLFENQPGTRRDKNALSPEQLQDMTVRLRASLLKRGIATTPDGASDLVTDMLNPDTDEAPEIVLRGYRKSSEGIGWEKIVFEEPDSDAIKEQKRLTEDVTIGQPVASLAAGGLVIWGITGAFAEGELLDGAMGLALVGLSGLGLIAFLGLLNVRK